MGLFNSRNQKDKQSFIEAKIIEINDFVNTYSNGNGLVKGGTLCFYGHWFGKPYDNYHKIVDVKLDKESNLVVIGFDQKETLTIWNPIQIEEKNKTIEIKGADKILWQWYYYGKIQIPENKLIIEITRLDKKLTGTSNIDWYKTNFSDLDINKPAIFLG